MVNLVIIADDFTGALDTGVQFASLGIETRVYTAGFYKLDTIQCSMEVLVVNAETRHLKAIDAYRKVKALVQEACRAGIPYIYKKTDSALRGNIGGELIAAMDGSGESTLHFIPAFPQMNRITKNGVHYIEGIPVRESVFGQDPFEPVKHSYIPDIIREQCEVTVLAGEKRFGVSKNRRILVYDAWDQEDLNSIAVKLKEEGGYRLMAGCAGFAAFLPDLLGLKQRTISRPVLKRRFLILCGSVNPITRCQLDYAESRGFRRIRLTPDQLLEPGYFQTEEGLAWLGEYLRICKRNEKVIIDTNDRAGSRQMMETIEKKGMTLEKARDQIARNLGSVLSCLLHMGLEATMLITGGDSLQGFMNQLQVHELAPIFEMRPGAVLSRFWLRGKSFEVISKSGGFGNDSMLADIADDLTDESYKMTRREDENGIWIETAGESDRRSGRLKGAD